MINTKTQQHTYTVEIWSNNGSIKAGTSPSATTPFLTLTPSKSTLQLNWYYSVPWLNYKHIVFKENPTGSGNFLIHGMTFTPSYTDYPITNGDTFCYFVMTIGKFNGHKTYKQSTFNKSQIACGVPWDFISPCSPVITEKYDTCASYHSISFYYPDTCEQDIEKFIIYKAPFFEGPYSPVDTQTSTNITYESMEMGNCYYVVAVDSFNNLSSTSDTICFDYCYEFDLPNVFTPDGDGINDFFTPIRYKNILAVSTTIYDRWGLFINHSTDPYVLWDGRNENGKKVPDGVYYYICEFYPLSVKQLRKRIKTGFIHLIGGSSKILH